MGKGGIAKSKRGPSLHSRAARRETSPSIDTDKSLKFAHTPQDPPEKPQRHNILGAHHNAGVNKPTSKRKHVLSSKARKRQEKSMDRAEAIMDRTAKKVEKSKGQAKVIHLRRRTWEEINSEAVGAVDGAKPVGKSKKISEERLAEDEYVRKFYADDGDEEMEEAEDVVESMASAAATTAASVQAPLVPLSVLPVDPPQAQEDVDEIL